MWPAGGSRTHSAHASHRNNNWSSTRPRGGRRRGGLAIGVAGEIEDRRLYNDGRVALQSGVRGTRLDIWGTAGDGGWEILRSSTIHCAAVSVGLKLMNDINPYRHRYLYASGDFPCRVQRLVELLVRFMAGTRWKR